MSSLFNNFSGDPRMQRHALITKYSAARTNLLMMIVFSAINILLLVTNSGTYFLFSASVPYLLTGLGMALCGLYPPEYYEEMEGMYFLDKSLFIIMLIVSLLILVIYLLLWIFSNKNRCGFLIAALALFSVDTVVMIWSYGLSSVLDLVLHIYLIVILAMGISAHYKLKKLPAEPQVIETEFKEMPAEDMIDEATDTQNN